MGGSNTALGDAERPLFNSAKWIVGPLFIDHRQT